MMGGCSSCSMYERVENCRDTPKTRTEYSHKTKLLVSRRLKSPLLRSPSPMLPPLPSFRPALSFFFLAVRTLLKCSSMLDGNCNAGRWNDLASCFDKRVLYCI